jgi:5-enolpyruvylshikimate-3-phosphate synthase
MAKVNTIVRMAVDNLNGVTTFGVSVTEDIGVAIAQRGVFEIRVEGKFEGINADAQAAVDAFMAEHATALGLA